MTIHERLDVVDQGRPVTTAPGASSGRRTRHWARNDLGHVVFVQPGRKPPHVTQMMTYPFPLHRESGIVWVRVILPDDLTMREANRIGEMLDTLPVLPEEAGR